MTELLAALGNAAGIALIAGIMLRFYFTFDRRAAERIKAAETARKDAAHGEALADQRADAERERRIKAEEQSAEDRAQAIAMRGEITSLRQEVERLRLDVQRLSGVVVPPSNGVSTVTTIRTEAS